MPGDNMIVYEEREIGSTGRTRARLREGWVSTSAEDGTVLLQSAETEHRITSTAQMLHDEGQSRMEVEVQLREEQDRCRAAEAELSAALKLLEDEKERCRSLVAQMDSGTDHAHSLLRTWLREQRLAHKFDAFARLLGEGGAPDDVAFLEDEDIAELDLLRLEERRLRAAIQLMRAGDGAQAPNGSPVSRSVPPLSPMPRTTDAGSDLAAALRMMTESGLLAPEVARALVASVADGGAAGKTKLAVSSPSPAASSPSPVRQSPDVDGSTDAVATIQRFARGRMLRRQLDDIKSEESKRHLRRQRSRTFLNEEARAQSPRDRELLNRGRVFMASPRAAVPLEQSVVTAQSMWRGRSLRARLEAATTASLTESEEDAATRIQAALRGAKARREVSELLTAQLEELEREHAQHTPHDNNDKDEHHRFPSMSPRLASPREIIGNVDKMDDRDVRKIAVQTLSRVFTRAHKAQDDGWPSA